MSALLIGVADKSVTKQELFRKVEQDPALLPALIEGLSSRKPTVRYSCGKVLMDLSEKYPERLYPYMDDFTRLLDSKFRILTWNAMFIIANLAKVDTDKKFEAIFDKYYGFLNNEYMVTVANVVGNSGKIALAKPDLANNIAKEILKVENIAVTPHLTEECRRVIAQQAIKSFNLFFNRLDDNLKREVHMFVERQVDSTRETLRNEAKSFLKRWNKVLIFLSK